MRDRCSGRRSASVFPSPGIGKFADMAGFAAMIGPPLFVAVPVALGEIAGGLGVLAGGALRRDWLTRMGGRAMVPTDRKSNPR